MQLKKISLIAIASIITSFSSPLIPVVFVNSQTQTEVRSQAQRLLKPTVVVSLWFVPDASTQYLMTEFYQKMQQSPDKVQALRSTMLATIKQNPNPRDWAAFTIIGEAL